MLHVGEGRSKMAHFGVTEFMDSPFMAIIFVKKQKCGKGHESVRDGPKSVRDGPKSVRDDQNKV